MYAHEMRRIDALPNGAPETALIALRPPVLMIGCLGRNGESFSVTHTGLVNY
jgi:hypothetical protein